MTEENEAGVCAPSTGAVWLLAALGALVVIAVVAYQLLFLSVPLGHSPVPGFAPKIGSTFGPPFTALRLSLSPGAFSRTAVLLLGSMWGAYVAAVWLVTRMREPGLQDRSLVVLWVGAASAMAILVVLPPTLSTDLYHYALFGRMVAHYGLNPYVTPGDAIAQDSLHALASWQWLSSHYGPVFTWVSALAAWLGGGTAVATSIAFKTLAAGCGLACLLAVRRLAAAYGPGLIGFALAAWNPLFLLETAGSGHNEAVMMAPALWGFLLASQGRRRLGYLLMLLSLHVKWVSGALLLVAFVRDLQDARGHRLRFTAEIGGVAIASAVALYAPFWEAARTFEVTLQLVGRGRAMVGATDAGPGVLGISSFLALCAGAMFVACRHRDRALESAAAVMLGFVVLVFDWAYPWYTIPALLLLAATRLDRPARLLLLATLWYGLYLSMQMAFLVRTPA